MKSVKNKETGQCGVSFNSDDRMPDFYVDMWYTISNSKGTYSVPHLKLIVDMYNEGDCDPETDNEVTVILNITENGLNTERTDRANIAKNYIELERRSVDAWEEELGTEYKIKNRYYDDRDLDLFEFWLNYKWDKLNLEK